jgi:hypothetical protein
MTKKKINIKKAIKRPGSLTQKAKAAGESPRQYAKSHLEAPGLAGKQSRFYWNMLGGSKKKTK